MLIEAVRRAETAAKEMLAAVNDGTSATSELREALVVSRAFMAAGAAFQTAAAAVIAKAERHGDGGTGVLADTAGMARSQARDHLKTAETLRSAPVVMEAVEAGRVSQANARRLADAVERVGANRVESDAALISSAESLRPEQFTKEARRWVADREGDGGEAEHARQRARRRVRTWDTDDGMVHLRGEFDAVAGRQIVNRLRERARRFHDSDKQAAKTTPGINRRSFDQCMADALDHLTATGGTNLTRQAAAAKTGTGVDTGEPGTNLTPQDADRGAVSGESESGGGEPFADVCVVAHLDDATGKLVAETPDGNRLPASVLEQLACNAKFTGVLFGRKGKPIWRANSVRSATDSQRQILFGIYGGCFHCGAHPGLCQIHHIEPVSEGGPTKISNMVPVCWDCHNLIHHHKWRVAKRDGYHSLHPPQHITCVPAHAPDHPPPPPPRFAAAGTPTRHGDARRRKHEPAPEAAPSLFEHNPP